MSAITTCSDKLLFARTLDIAGLPAITTSLSIEGITDDRLVVKERRGAGARRVRIDCSAEEAARAAASLREPVFQPFVPGREVSIDAYRTRDGRILGLIARSRDLVIGGESQVTTTLDPAPYAALVAAVVDALDVQGHCVVQVLDGPQGPRVIECNARLGGASTLALAAGLMSLAWFVRESEGLDPAELAFTPRPSGMRLVRVPQDVIRDPGL